MLNRLLYFDGFIKRFFDNYGAQLLFFDCFIFVVVNVLVVFVVVVVIVVYVSAVLIDGVDIIAAIDLVVDVVELLMMMMLLLLLCGQLLLFLLLMMMMSMLLLLLCGQCRQHRHPPDL